MSCQTCPVQHLLPCFIWSLNPEKHDTSNLFSWFQMALKQDMSNHAVQRAYLFDTGDQLSRSASRPDGGLGYWRKVARLDWWKVSRLQGREGGHSLTANAVTASATLTAIGVPIFEFVGRCDPTNYWPCWSNRMQLAKSWKHRQLNRAGNCDTAATGPWRWPRLGRALRASGMMAVT